jgi:16S rRNA processing protein RimM
MHNEESSWIVLAHLLRPQGRKGELLAELLTDFPDQFDGREDLFLAPPQFRGERADARSVQVISSWLPVGKNRGRIVLHLAGIDTISDAESLVGLDVIVPEDGRLSLDEDSAYVSDLIGCSVFDSETLVGEITGVEFPTSSEGARLDDMPSLLEVRSENGDEVLIPYAKAFLISVDLGARKIVLALPAGLVDVNR